MLYTSRPPASAKSARQAWDYFAANNRGRTIARLYYSQTQGRGWIAEFNITEQDTGMWQGGDLSWAHQKASADTIRRWAA